MCAARRLSFVLALLFSALLWAQEGTTSSSEVTPTSDSSPQLTSMIEIASSLSQDSDLLVRRLEERKRQASESVTSSQATVQALSDIVQTSSEEIESEQSESAESLAQSSKVEIAIGSSQTASTETSSSLDTSLSAADSLRLDFDNYKTTAEASIKREHAAATTWRIIAIFCAALGIGGIVYGVAQ